MPLIMGMCVLLGCQFIGELMARGLAVPVPGPVLGMVVLLVGLIMHGRVPASLRQTGEGLLRYLTLLFVPAGVGLMVHVDLIRDDFWALLAALVASTAITLAVTAKVLDLMSRRWKVGRK